MKLDVIVAIATPIVLLTALAIAIYLDKKTPKK